MEQKVLQSLEASKHEYSAERYEGALKGLRDQLHLAARRMDDFIGSMENRMAEFGVRLDHESTVNAHFRSAVQHHLCAGPPPDATLQEGFEIISVAKDNPMVFATPQRRPYSVSEEEQPLCPKDNPSGEQNHRGKSCTSWPRFLRRRPVLK
jgi:hypothetical protein